LEGFGYLRLWTKAVLKGLIAAALLAVKGLIIAGLTRDLNIVFIKVDCEEKKKKREKREKNVGFI
jgi:hypothetical protein